MEFTMTTAHIDTFVIDGLPAAPKLPQFIFETPNLQFPERANVVNELLDRAVHEKGFANNVLLRSEQVTFTYAEVADRVNRIAQVLVEDYALIPGNRVLLRGGNSVGIALAWLAVVKAGLIAVATMPLLRAKELGEIIVTAKPSLAICAASLREELDIAIAARSDTSPVLPVIEFGAPDSANDLGALVAKKTGHFVACDTACTDPAMLAFTSGTTGKPKAAVQTHRDLLASCECWPRHVLRALPSDIVIGTPPLAFTFGLGGLLLFPMAAGASVYFPSKPPTPESAVQTIRDVGATIFYTAPTYYRQMATFARATPMTSLRICVSAGEGLPDATRTLWRESTGIEMIDGIGATEMFHIFISSAGADIRRGAIGKVVPGYVAKIIDEAGNELPRGTIGKLAVIGPTGCKYLNEPRQANYVKDGWNHPGDAFLQDENGYFFYQARADDMIITAGYNVGGPEVEDALLKHAAVAECGVIGAPDEARGMIVKAFVVLKPDYAGDSAMVRALQDHVKAMIAPYKYPREIEFCMALPRTETGKLQRFKLRELKAGVQ
jgi:2-aminobenzoate-CoA ligase